jgi:5-(carboxyamino)imidazole ribonucleotide synthase
MFALSARVLGFRVVVLDPDPRSPAGQVADAQIVAAYDDPSALDQLAERCAAVTTEFENVPASVLERLAARVPVRPGAEAVAITQDRIAEKTFLCEARLATAGFAPVRTPAELDAAVAAIGTPALLKTSRLGYDGKGQAAVQDANAAADAWEQLGKVPCVLEQRLNLEAEISVVLARGHDGVVEVFPVGENVHRHGILHTTTVPARLPAALLAHAAALASQVAGRLEYVGVLAVEMFVANGGQLYVNELAPRAHNSGHYTLDACSVDQFEQQARALAGLPLGRATLLTPCCMVNILGDAWAHGTPRWDRALAIPGVRLHLYGKAEPRAGRKMGHITCLAPTADEALTRATEAHAALSAP